VADRDAKPFDTKTALLDRIRQSDIPATPDLVDVRSDWFAVRVTVQQDDVQLSTEALVKRRPAPDGTATVVWRRPWY
jgi:type II secretory pathway component PulK